MDKANAVTPTNKKLRKKAVMEVQPCACRDLPLDSRDSIPDQPLEAVC